MLCGCAKLLSGRHICSVVPTANGQTEAENRDNLSCYSLFCPLQFLLLDDNSAMIRPLIVSFFCLITTSTSLDLNSEYEDTVKPYVCLNWCVARCLTVDKLTSDACKNRCNNYNAPILCSDSTCWSQCKDLEKAGGSGIPTVVEKVDVNYSPNDSGVVVLNWQTVAKANLYLVVYRDSDDKFDKWEPVEELITAPQYLFTKPYFCLRYSFKVAAVSDSGVGPFSTVETIGKPELNISQSQVVLKLKSLVNTGSEVLGRIYYDLGPAWKPTRIKTTRTVLQILAADVPNGEAVRPKLFPNSTEVEMAFSLNHIKHKSKYVMAVDKLFSVCDTNMSNPLNMSSALVLNINCDTVANSGCTEKKPPCTVHTRCLQLTEMNLTWIQPNVTVGNPSGCNSTSAVLNWDQIVEKDSYGNNCTPIKFWAKYGIADQSVAAFKELLMAKNVLEELQFPSWQRSYEFHNLTLGEFYYFSVCEVYSNHPSLQPVDWNVNVKLAGNSKDVLNTCLQAAAKKPAFSQTKMIIAVTVLIAAALVSVGITVFCVFRSRRERERLKKVEQMISGRFERRGNDYVWIEKPIVKEKWELDRQRLIVYDAEKPLGAGAFGKVLKGRIVGKVQTHKDSQSVLAQKQEELRDCLVAVKQCYEYADNTTKSQFRQEIELMKMLGHHPHLVNMLYCITDTEPLCLVVEFCDGGDLRQYLRNNRKYMLDLERLGIDLTTDIKPDEFGDGKILSIKDLVLFSFQISDGLEYLHQKGYIHRDLAARNILLDKSRFCKIGDFGLCRYVETDPAYISHGGKVPIKWMALEALKEYRFSAENDIWSFGVLLFEIITLGGTPYPDVLPQDGDFQKAMIDYLEAGKRLEQPDNCPVELYEMMKECWAATPEKRPPVSDIRERLRQMLESIVKEPDDMYLDPNRSYYNVTDTWDEERMVTEDENSVENSSPADIQPVKGSVNEAFVDEDYSAFDPVKPTLSDRRTDSTASAPTVPQRITRQRTTSPSVTSTNSFDSDWSDQRSAGPLISPRHGKVLNDYKGAGGAQHYSLDTLKEADVQGDLKKDPDDIISYAKF